MELLGSMSGIKGEDGDFSNPHSSVFVKDLRRRMNVVPIFLNVMVPWTCFTITFSMFSFSFYHYHANLCSIGFGATLVVVGLMTLLAVRSHIYELNPMWYKMSILLILLALIGGMELGKFNYHKHMMPYYQNHDLASYPNADPSILRGTDLIDAGRVYWTFDTDLDFSKAWHFKHGDIYCVVPIVKVVGSTPVKPKYGSYDFWAVGKNCCSEDAPDFRCGQFLSPIARSSLRLTDADARPYYRLAVQQAETTFDIISSQPTFYTWEHDPLAVLMNWQARGFRMFVLCIVAHFLVSVILVILISWRFAFIGRKPLPEDLLN